MNLLVSYPRSGSTWVRYIVECGSKRPTKGLSEDDPAIGELYPLGIDLSKEPILKKRNSLLLRDITEDNKVVLIVRNYRDVFVRKAIKQKQNNEFFVKNFFDEGYISYMANLKDYHEFPGKKLLVYYEDLIKSPDVEIFRIYDFLEIEEDNFYKFMDSYEQHFRCSLGIYRRECQSSDINIHHDSIPTALKKYMDDMMVYHAPIMYADYLSRYISS